jgi:transcriptional regulator with XRE-family HTH domain
MNLGVRIKKLRQARGLTLPELASRTGISKGYVWKIEKSGEDRSVRVRPSNETLAKIAATLGVTVEDLTREAGGGRRPGRSVRRITRPTLPDTLEVFLKECRRKNEPVPESEVFMLSMIQHRGKRPKAVEDWRFVYEAIKRGVRG